MFMCERERKSEGELLCSFLWSVCLHGSLCSEQRFFVAAYPTGIKVMTFWAINQVWNSITYSIFYNVKGEDLGTGCASFHM